jgi:serine/threonine protein kinase
MAFPVARVERIARVRGDVTEVRPRRKRPRAASGAQTPAVRLSQGLTAPFRKADEVRFGPFVIREQIGEGGMARVHRAELVGAAGFRKSVALKRMRTELTEDPDSVAAFVHEAQLASRLRHPNIAEAYDLGKFDGTYYIAMEYVPGPTLAAVMAQSRRAAGLVPLPIVLEILIQLCDALEHAHDLCDAGGRPLDLVHRDISPANVILATSGSVKLIDFGIAKDRSARARTEAGVIKGKHAYIAPEYTYGQLDRRADLFALGVIAHELLTGRRLFLGANDFATLYNVRTKPIPPPSRYQPIVPHALAERGRAAQRARRGRVRHGLRGHQPRCLRMDRVGVSPAAARRHRGGAFTRRARAEHFDRRRRSPRDRDDLALARSRGRAARGSRRHPRVATRGDRRHRDPRDPARG